MRYSLLGVLSLLLVGVGSVSAQPTRGQEVPAKPGLKTKQLIEFVYEEGQAPDKPGQVTAPRDAPRREGMVGALEDIAKKVKESGRENADAGTPTSAGGTPAVQGGKTGAALGMWVLPEVVEAGGNVQVLVLHPQEAQWMIGEAVNKDVRTQLEADKVRVLDILGTHITLTAAQREALSRDGSLTVSLETPNASPFTKLKRLAVKDPPARVTIRAGGGQGDRRTVRSAPGAREDERP